MPITVAEKLVIQGGVGSAPWVPREVLHSDGKRFIGLAATDCQLRRFLGCTRYGTTVRPNAFQLGQPAALLESLRSHRNDRVDEMIEFPLPGYEERLALIKLYFDKYAAAMPVLLEQLS